MKKKVFIAGHSGMVGSAIWRLLKSTGSYQLFGYNSNELDLRDQRAVHRTVEDLSPDIIIDAAARVGGILANNSYPYEFLMDNLLIQNNLIHAAFHCKIPQFIFLGSSCIYPRLAEQPLKEESILSGPLESTNQWYAIAKIAGVKAIEALRNEYRLHYVSLMPTNLYGPNDNFDLNTSHVIPAMIRKFHEAKLKGDKFVTLWGSGQPMREFMHVDDLAKAIRFVMEKENKYSVYNVGIGSDISIKELALMIQNIVGHTGEIAWDTSKPDGTPRKLMDVSKLMEAGWSPSIRLEDGLRSTYEWFLNNPDLIREKKIQNIQQE